MHGDEANQAFRAGILLESGEYRYDPREHHGPTLYYLARVSSWLSGKKTFKDTTEFTYRIVPVVFGVMLVLLLWPIRRGLGVLSAVFAGILTALSPAFVFYSRYFIQEMILVGFTFGAIVSGWRYAQKPSLGWALATGACLGLMYSTKETCVIAFAAMSGALVVTALMSHGRAGAWGALRESVKARHALAGAALGAAIAVVLFSAFFTNARGPLDSLLAYANYAGRGSSGGGGIHDKPWFYYLQTLAFVHRRPGPWWSEGFVLGLAVVGLLAISLRKADGHRPFLMFLASYAVLMTLLYSAIPYKTPWTMLSFYHAVILCAGVGMAAIVRATRHPFGRVCVLLLFALGLGHLGLQSYQGNYRYPADPRNPYVYAHTSSAFMRLVERTEDLASIHPDGHGMVITVIQPDKDYWPLPWYLRRFEKVGYWHELPEDLDAAVIIASPKVQPLLDEILRDEYVTELHGLRPSVLRVVYIRKDLWDAFIKTRL